MDEGIRFGIQAVEVKAHELYGIGIGRLCKLEASIQREIDKVKGGQEEFSEGMRFNIESWMLKTSRNYKDIYKRYNHKYRNYPDKQVVHSMADDYDGQFANIGTKGRYADTMFDGGVWLGIKLTLVHLNNSLQVGAPRLAKLEAEVVQYVRRLRLFNLEVACHELWIAYQEIEKPKLKKMAKLMGAENALAELNKEVSNATA